ncbi:MAG: asparaginase domain-containing protein [Woeseiaceae bacterium]|nr:asparaginase domain-containing protein [Woeseiaceae bacterium]
MFIRFITTGGTIDKVYFDALSQFEVGDSPLDAILADGMVNFTYDVVPMFRKDSLELTDADREALKTFISNDDADRYVISHGTDTMVETSMVLQSLTGKTIVITGSLSPARFKTTDAIFNVGMAVAAVQASNPGVYIAMSGQVFKADSVRKNRTENRFELL